MGQAPGKRWLSVNQREAIDRLGERKHFDLAPPQ